MHNYERAPQQDIENRLERLIRYAAELLRLVELPKRKIGSRILEDLGSSYGPASVYRILGRGFFEEGGLPNPSLEIEELVRTGVIDPKASGPILRLIEFVHQGKSLPRHEYERWRELAYLRTDMRTGRHYIALEDHTTLLWRLMACAYLGELERVYEDGSYKYRSTDIGRDKAQKKLEKLHKFNESLGAMDCQMIG